MSSISSLQLSRHYAAHSTRASAVLENLETLRERIQPITRQVPSNDDEVYDVDETWDGSAWVSR